MDILLAFIFGGTAGAVLHYLMPGRASRGAALPPVLGAAVGGLVWLVFTWSGVTTTSPWIWIASIAAPLIVVPLALLALARARTTHDARERLRLRIS